LGGLLGAAQAATSCQASLRPTEGEPAHRPMTSQVTKLGPANAGMAR